MAALFNFEVHTPYRLFFSGKAEAVTLTLVDGEIGVYAKHSSFTAPSVSGILRVKDSESKWRSAFISDGILEVKEHKTVLMVDNAEWPEEIDIDGARAAEQEAKENLKMADLKFEIDNAKTKLRYAQFRQKAWELRGEK